MNDFNIPGWDSQPEPVHEHIGFLRQHALNLRFGAPFPYSANQMERIADRYETLEKVARAEYEWQRDEARVFLFLQCSACNTTHHEICPTLRELFE